MKKLISILLMLCICFSASVMFTACNGSKSTLTKEEYIEVYSKVISEVNVYTNSVSMASPLSVVISDADFIEVPTNQGKNAIKGNTAMLYFLRNILNVQTFEIVDGFQDIQVIDNVSSPNTQTFKIRLSMSYDKETGEIKSMVYVEDYTSSNIIVNSLEFTFNYNFESKTLSGFTVLGVMGYKGSLTANGVNYLKYTNGTLYRINPESTVFPQFATDVLAKCVEVGANPFGSNLPDYSNQYITAMQEAFA